MHASGTQECPSLLPVPSRERSLSMRAVSASPIGLRHPEVALMARCTFCRYDLCSLYGHRCPDNCLAELYQ